MKMSQGLSFKIVYLFAGADEKRLENDLLCIKGDSVCQKTSCMLKSFEISFFFMVFNGI